MFACITAVSGLCILFYFTASLKLMLEFNYVESINYSNVVYIRINCDFASLLVLMFIFFPYRCIADNRTGMTLIMT